VVGRSLPFDRLLADHRAAKEELLRRKMSSKLAVLSPQTVTTRDLSHSSLAADYKSLPSPAVTSPSYSSPAASQVADVEPSASPRVPERSPSPPTKPSWRSAWKARCALLRSARLFRVLAPSHFAPSTDDQPVKRFATSSSSEGFLKRPKDYK